MAECRYPFVEKQVDELKKSVDDITKTQLKHGERLASVEQSAKSAHKSLSELKKQTETIINIAGDIRVIMEKVKELVEKITEHDDMLDVCHNKILEIEKKPGEIALKNWQIFVGACIAGVAGYLIKHLF